MARGSAEFAAEAALLRRWRDEGRVRMLATTAEEMA